MQTTQATEGYDLSELFADFDSEEGGGSALVPPAGSGGNGGNGGVSAKANYALEKQVKLFQNAPLIDQVMLLNLAIGTMGTSKRGDLGLLDGLDADIDAMRLSKRIFRSREKTSNGTFRIVPCPEIAAISTLLSRIRAFVRSVMLPQTEQFRSGMYLVPISLTNRCENFLRAAGKELDMRVEELLAVYDERIEDDREILQSQFNREDYPERSDVLRAYRLSYEYVSLATPEGLKKVSQEIFQRETERLNARIQDAAEESKFLIMAKAKELAMEISKRLIPGEDGKVRTIAGPLKEWLDFLDTFGAKNITGDEELAALMADVKSQLQGKTTKDIKKTPVTAAAYFDGIAAKLDSLIVDSPERMFSFGGDDEDTLGGL